MLYYRWIGSLVAVITRFTNASGISIKFSTQWPALVIKLTFRVDCISSKVIKDELNASSMHSSRYWGLFCHTKETKIHLFTNVRIYEILNNVTWVRIATIFIYWKVHSMKLCFSWWINTLHKVIDVSNRPQVFLTEGAKKINLYFNYPCSNFVLRGLPIFFWDKILMCTNGC